MHVKPTGADTGAVNGAAALAVERHVWQSRLWSRRSKQLTVDLDYCATLLC